MAEKYDLQETRNRLVAKDNRLIQNSRYSLGANENKAILYLISKIRPEDEPGKLYTFNCKEFRALIRWDKDSPYSKIKAMLTSLSYMQWWITLDNGKESLVRWFHVVRMDPGTEDIEIKFHEDMFPFLLKLNQRLGGGEYFTSYRLQNVTLMKHRYSIRIYEILKSYAFNNSKWTFENGTGSKYDLQCMIGDVILEEGPDKGKPVIPEGWKNWAIFKRDVLEPAVMEINRYSDLKVAYTGKKEDLHHKKSRAVRSIEFYMARKTRPEQRHTDELIDKEYTTIEDRKKYHQYTIEEFSVEEAFFKAHGVSVEMERIEEEQAEREKNAEKSVYPLLYSGLNNERNASFDDKKVGVLYQTAIKDRVIGEVDAEYWEIFAADLVLYYYDRIEATPEETKTTPYRRLLDCLAHDYDGVVHDLIKKYRKD